VKHWSLLLAAAYLATQAAPAGAQQQPAGGSMVSQTPVYRIVVTGTIELGLAPYVGRGIAEANDAGALAVILDIDTFGGRVDAAEKIVTATIASEIPVYAFVRHNAWSAGALIALAADSIFMTPGSSIGAATPVSGAGEKLSEKVVSAMRSEFRALAERRGLDPRIAESMVDESIEIDGVIEEGKLLTLTAHEAVELNVAAAEVADLDALLERLNLDTAGVETVSINWAESLVRFLSNPLVAPILLSVGTLGLIIEIKTPSFGLAGLTGLLALGAFFGSHLIIGLAGMEEIILLGVGMVALAIEVFLVPGFGVAGIVAILCIGAATFMALIGALPTWGDVSRASGIMIAAAAIVAGVVFTLVRQLPTSRRWGGILLKDATDRESGFVSEPERDDLIDAIGVAITDLRPSGTVQIGDERLDVVSDTGFIAKGSRVRVIRWEGYRHVVEPADEALPA
jgi:membrane-bound serine protease (ClpP class)